MATPRKDKPRKSLRELTRETFKTPSGLQLLDELVHTYVHRPAFDLDPHKTAYMAGERGLVLLLHQFTHAPLEDPVDAGNDSDADSAFNF